MTVFSRRTKTTLLAGSALLLSMGFTLAPQQALSDSQTDSRMAGTPPPSMELRIGDTSFSSSYQAQTDDERTAGGLAKREEKTEVEKHKPAQRDGQNEDRQQELKIPPPNLFQDESQGLLETPVDGGMGIDVWDGSSRSEIRGILTQLTGAAAYSALFTLERRLLLTRTDINILKQDEQPQPGQDMMTLRLERLMDMGLYDDAARLYATTEGNPYDEHIANAGIIAMLLSHQRALGCLEARALNDRFGETRFWKKFSDVCRLVMESIAPASLPDDKEIVTVLQTPPLPEKAGKVKNTDERKSFKEPKSPAALETLSREDLAALIATGKIDYNKWALSLQDNIKPSVLGALLYDPALPEEMRFALMIKALRIGMKTPADLAAYYEEFKFDAPLDAKSTPSNIANIEHWKQIAYLYSAAAKYKKDTTKISGEIIRAALAKSSQYDTVALLPFAEMIAESSPSGLSGESIRAGARVMVMANQKISESWQKKISDELKKSDKKNGKDLFLTLLASEIGRNSHFFETYQHTEIKGFFEYFMPRERDIIKLLYKMLDKNSEFHNYTHVETKESFGKIDGLTSNDDYVMPSIGLLDNLKSSFADKRPGEVVLLSSIALRDAPPEKIYPGTLREVVDGLKAVGLTVEAQSLAKEVILGLGK